MYYFRSFKQSKGAGNDGIVTFSALAGDLPAGCSIPDPSNPSSSFYSAPANRLSAFAAKMGGLFHSVCDPSFDQVFDDLGATAAELKRTFRLAKVPDVATLVVDVRARCDSPQSALAFCQSVNDECSSGEPGLVCTPKADAFTFDAPTNSLVFTAQAVPPRGSQVEAQYSEQGTGAAQ